MRTLVQHMDNVYLDFNWIAIEVENARQRIASSSVVMKGFQNKLQTHLN